MLFWTLGGRIPEISGNSGNFGKFRGTNLCNFGKFGKSVPEKTCFLQNTLCAAGYPPGNSGGNSDIFGHFFSRNVTNLQKNAKKIAKKRKKCKKKHPEKHPEIFGVFSRKQGCTDLLNHWKKGRKCPRKSRVHTPCTLFFPEISARGIFGGFSGLST